MGDFSNPAGNDSPRQRRAAGWRFSTATGGITNTTAVVAKAAETGVRQGIKALDYINTSATASEFEVLSAANVIYRGYAPANMTVPASVPGLAERPLFGNSGEAISVKMVTTATATRFNLRGDGFDG